MGIIILTDPFVDNYDNNWYTDNFSNFDTYGYNYNNSDDTIWSGHSFKLSLPENFDVELTSTWKSGVTSYSYGLILDSNLKNFYEFTITKNGHAGGGLWQAESYVRDTISWKLTNSITTPKKNFKN